MTKIQEEGENVNLKELAEKVVQSFGWRSEAIYEDYAAYARIIFLPSFRDGNRAGRSGRGPRPDLIWNKNQFSWSDLIWSELL